jgi:hypothetical protein
LRNHTNNSSFPSNVHRFTSTVTFIVFILKPALLEKSSTNGKLDQ